MSLPKKYLTALWTTARNVMEVYPEIFGNETEFRDWLDGRYGKRSTRALTERQAGRAIETMKNMLGEDTGDGKPRISERQDAKISALSELLGWQRKQLWGFIERQTNQKKSEDMLLKKEATKIIIGMQRILAGGDQQRYDKLNRSTAKQLIDEAN